MIQLLDTRVDVYRIKYKKHLENIVGENESMYKGKSIRCKDRGRSKFVIEYASLNPLSARKN